MTFPDALLKGTADRIMIGLTNIYIDKKDHSIKITHAGNMGNSIANVRENVDRATSEGTFDMLRAKAKKETETGSPDYLYTLVLEF